MPMQVVNSNGKINYSSSGYEFTSSNSVQEFNADISKGLDIQGPVNIEFTLDDSVVNVTVDDLKTFQKNFGIQTSSGNLTVNAGTGSAYQQSQEQPLQVRFYSDNDAKVNSASGYGGIVDAAYHNLKSSISTLTSPLQGFMSSGTGKVNEASARKNQQQHQPQPQPPQQQRNNQHQPQQHYQQQEQNRQQASPPPVIRRETSSNNGYNNYNPGRQQEHQQYHHQSYQQQNHQQNYGARYQHVQRNTCPRPSMISSATSLASSIIYAPFAASYKVAATSLDAATYVSKVATEKATMYAESIKTSTVQGAQVAKRVAETSINSTLPYMPSLIESPLRYTLSYLPLNITPKIGMVSFISVGHGDPELFTLYALHTLQHCDVVVSDPYVPKPVLDVVRANIRSSRVLKFVASPFNNMNKGKSSSSSSQYQRHAHPSVDMTLSYLNMGYNVVRLKNGDPFNENRNVEDWDEIVGLGYTAQIIPCVSSSRFPESVIVANRGKTTSFSPASPNASSSNPLSPLAFLSGSSSSSRSRGPSAVPYDHGVSPISPREIKIRENVARYD